LLICPENFVTFVPLCEKIPKRIPAGSAEHLFGMKQRHDAELVLGIPGQGLNALLLRRPGVSSLLPTALLGLGDVPISG